MRVALVLILLLAALPLPRMARAAENGLGV